MIAIVHLKNGYRGEETGPGCAPPVNTLRIADVIETNYEKESFLVKTSSGVYHSIPLHNVLHIVIETAPMTLEK